MSSRAASFQSAFTRLSAPRRARGALAMAALALASLALAGCDKCGDPVKFNTPSLPKSCYGVAEGK